MVAEELRQFVMGDSRYWLSATNTQLITTASSTNCKWEEWGIPQPQPIDPRTEAACRCANAMVDFLHNIQRLAGNDLDLHDWCDVKLDQAYIVLDGVSTQDMLTIKDDNEGLGIYDDTE